MRFFDTVTVSADAVTLTYGDPRGPKQLEVRLLADPAGVVFRTHATKGYDVIDCARTEGRWLVWIQWKQYRGSYVPGPLEPYQVRASDIVTGTSRVLAQGQPHAYDQGPSCPTFVNGHVRWYTTVESDRLTLTDADLPLGTSTTTPAAGQQIAVTGGGIIVRGPDRNPRSVWFLDARTGRTRLVRVLPAQATEVEAGGDRLAWWVQDPAHDQGLNNPMHVFTCVLPRCARVQRLSDTPNSGNGHVSDNIVSWASISESIDVATFNGVRVPDMRGQQVGFRAQDVDGDVLAWVSLSPTGYFGQEGSITLHIAQLAAHPSSGGA